MLPCTLAALDRYGANQTQTYNADDTINQATTPAGTQTFGYFTTGNLQTDGCNTYTYDGLDRTTKISNNPGGGTCPAASTATYTYDALGRQRTHTDTPPTTPVTTAIAYDGTTSTIAAETPQTGATPATAYTISPTGAAVAVTALAATNTSQNLATDGTGTIALTTNNDTQSTVACTARFDPYGTPANPQPADPQHTCNTGTTPNDLFYNAGRRDTTTGTYQNGARTYDPTKNSYLTPDTPTGPTSAAAISVGTDPLTANTYTYVNGDPINLTDPTGHIPRSACARFGVSGQDCDEAVVLDKGLSASQKSYSGFDLARRCGSNLSCSIGDLNALSIDQRRSWLTSFTQGPGAQLHAEDWFAAVSGVLHFASDEGIGTPGSWFSWVDASILYGVEGGAALALGRPVAPTDVAGLSASSDSGPGKWKEFFEARLHGQGSANSQRELWAQAEIDSTNFGVFNVAPAVGMTIPCDNNPAECLAYAGSELWRRTNENLGIDSPALEAASIALGGLGAISGGFSGAWNNVSNCDWYNPFCIGYGTVSGGLSGAWNGLTEGRVQSFFDPRNSWGTYGGAHCLYDHPVGASACIAELIESH